MSVITRSRRRGATTAGRVPAAAVLAVIPCGGPLKNDFSKIYRSVDGVLGRQDWDLDREPAMTRTRETADRLGYTLSPERTRPDGVRLGATNPDGLTFSLTSLANGGIQARAETPCLDHPRS